MRRSNSNEMMIGVGESTEKHVKKRQARAGGDDDDEHASDHDKELFSEVFGKVDEDAVAVAERKKQEKKKLVAQITLQKSLIKPFVWSTSLIKEDPLKAYKLEEKRENLIPKAMQPKEPTEKLQAKLKQNLASDASKADTGKASNNN